MGDISDEEGFSMQNSRLYAISYHKDGRPIDWIPLNESITEDLKSITFSMNGKDIYISSSDKKWIMRDGKFISLWCPQQNRLLKLGKDTGKNGRKK